MKKSRRYIVNLVKAGKATDITRISLSEAKQLRETHSLTAIAYSSGSNGTNARLYQDQEGNLYAVTARSTMIDYLPY